MKIEFTPLEGCKRQLDIEIPGDIVNKEIARASDEMSRAVRVPGFRPGRVPRSVVMQRYKTELRQEALRNLLPSAVETAVERHKLRVVGEPGVEKLDFKDDGTLNFTVGIEVFPDFTVGDYKGLALTKKVYSANDEDVDRVLTAMREEAAELVADDAEGREARDGDFLSVDLEGTYVEAEGEKHAHDHEPLKADDVTLEIGGAGVLQEFSDNMRGMKVGESRTFRVEYPKEFGNPALAGHTVEYTARLAAIRTKDVPALDDDFAATQAEGKYETAEALRAAVREDLEMQAAARTDQEAQEAVIDLLLAGNEFPVPNVFVDEQAQSRLQNMVRGLANQGADPRSLNIDWASVRESARSAAERDVRAALIIDRIAETEKVEVSDEELDGEIARIAESLGQPEPAVRARLTKEGGADTIRNRIRHRKVLDLVGQAAQTTVEEVHGLGAKTGESEASEGAEAGPEAKDE